MYGIISLGRASHDYVRTDGRGNASHNNEANENDFIDFISSRGLDCGDNPIDQRRENLSQECFPAKLPNMKLFELLSVDEFLYSCLLVFWLGCSIRKPRR